MYDCDIPEFYHETFPVAAKEHACCECSAPIEVGEKHLYARGKNDGEFWADRQHMLCRELCMLMNRMSDDGCCPFGMMKETFREGDEWEGVNFRDKKRQENAHARRLMAQILRREREAKRAVAC